jgi:hypothetical protein
MTKTSWKFFDVKSLTGVHYGIHAIRNIIKSDVLTLDEFCTAAGIDVSLPHKEKLEEIEKLDRVKEANEFLDYNEDDWVVLAVCSCENGSAVTYRPAVLMCKD